MSNVDSLDWFKRSVVDKVKSDICILQKGYNSKENNMKIKYANDFVKKIGLGDLKTCVYQFIYNPKDNNHTQIIQYFIMHGLGLCIKVDSYVAHFFNAWSFSHNTLVRIAKKKNKYFLSLNTNTTVFSWGSINSTTVPHADRKSVWYC